MKSTKLRKEQEMTSQDLQRGDIEKGFEWGNNALPMNSKLAIDELFRGKNKGKELPLLQVYLNYAVTNLQDIGALNREDVEKETFEPYTVTKDNKVTEGIYERIKRFAQKDPRSIQALTNFLWQFKMGNDDPSKEVEYTAQFAALIYSLRNFFCHLGRGNVDSICVSTFLYHFLAGELAGLAQKKYWRQNTPREMFLQRNCLSFRNNV